jgi:serine/threonine protein kinase
MELVNMELVNNRYLVLERLGSGAFGSIFKAQNVRTKEFVAIKVESIQEELKLLKNESKIYHYLNGTVGIPQVKWYGKDERNYYMVINLLGASLQDVLNKRGRFSLALTLKVGIKMLTILQAIHDKGFVHRDIKPDNFLFGVNQCNELYLIDFGFCKARSALAEPREVSSLIGSNNYASLMAHRRFELGRRDDMESFCYVLFSLYHGSLPWSYTSNENEILALKKQFVHDQTQPLVLLDLLRTVRCMEFDEKPNYYLVIDGFKREIESLSENCIKHNP